MKFELPIMEIIEFDGADAITTSKVCEVYETCQGYCDCDSGQHTCYFVCADYCYCKSDR